MIIQRLKIGLGLCLLVVLACEADEHAEEIISSSSNNQGYSDNSYNKIVTGKNNVLNVNTLVYEVGKTGFWQFTGDMKPESGYADDDLISEGFYKNDMKYGKWVEYDKNQLVHFEAIYYNDTLNGPCKRYLYKDGIVLNENYRMGEIISVDTSSLN